MSNVSCFVITRLRLRIVSSAISDIRGFENFIQQKHTFIHTRTQIGIQWLDRDVISFLLRISVPSTAASHPTRSLSSYWFWNISGAAVCETNEYTCTLRMASDERRANYIPNIFFFFCSCARRTSKIDMSVAADECLLRIQLRDYVWRCRFVRDKHIARLTIW